MKIAFFAALIATTSGAGQLLAGTVSLTNLSSQPWHLVRLADGGPATPWDRLTVAPGAKESLTPGVEGTFTFQVADCTVMDGRPMIKPDVFVVVSHGAAAAGEPGATTVQVMNAPGLEADVKRVFRADTAQDLAIVATTWGFAPPSPPRASRRLAPPSVKEERKEAARAVRAARPSAVARVLDLGDGRN